MSFACTFKRRVYGISGNELPPPLKHTHHLTLLSNDFETEEMFKQRMGFLGMKLRHSLSDLFKTNPRPYSREDGLDWEITVVVKDHVELEEEL